MVEAEPDGVVADAALLRAYWGGDRQAFARLYDRHDRSCFHFVRRMLGPAHAAAFEDVHQEVWVAVCKNASAFDPSKAGFLQWLFTIARHKVFDYLRRQKVVPLRSDLDESRFMAPDPGPSPLEQVEARELADRLVSAVEALPLDQRETFLMFAHGEVSLAEVAEATGVPVETAKSRLRYARARLRQALAEGRAALV